ncbi:hypothetical protein [Streptomyces sp. 061-3]|uniref:hypothetical protein n=1 Tax=Streptomyces sp. 061-3 TaxID=2789268 RepID=UPI00397F3F7B
MRHGADAFTSEDVVERFLEPTRGQDDDSAIETLCADATFQAAVEIAVRREVVITF